MALSNSKDVAQRAATTIMLRNLVACAEPVRMDIRPHTWVFLRQRDNPKEPVIRLGIVFHTWPRKFNMLRFKAHTHAGDEVTATARLAALDNGEMGVVLNHRWCWDTMLSQYKGLSAGNL